MLPTKQMNEQINRMLQSDVITSSKCQILFRNHFCKDPGDEMDKRLLVFAKIVQTRENGTVLTAVCTSDAK